MHTESSFVILLHGLARTSKAMNTLQKRLNKCGYRTLNISYPSTQHSIENLSDTVYDEIVQRCLAHDPTHVHFVTHSMGGIILRYIMKHRPISCIGNTVMLGPPNHGSEVVDKLRHLRIFHWLNGPAGQQLGTDERSIPQQLGSATFPVGIIAGRKSINPLLSLLINKPNDGKVSVESSKLNGMKDFVVMNTTHTFMMYNPQVIQQVIHFLEHGYFKR